MAGSWAASSKCKRRGTRALAFMVKPLFLAAASARSFAREPGLGYLAGYGTEKTFRSVCLCAVAMLEGVWDGRCRRPDGAPDQWHAICLGHQRGSATGVRNGRH